MRYAGPANDAHEDEEKPSFGGSLDHLIASPSSSRRSGRIIQKRQFTNNSGHASSKETIASVAIAQDGSQVLRVTGSPEGKVSMPSFTSGTIKNEDLEDTFDSPVPLESPSLSSSPTGTPGSRKKRKMYDEKQFESMKGIPDRIAPDLDSKFRHSPPVHNTISITDY